MDKGYAYLATWTALQTNPSPVPPFLFTVPNATNASRCFYRSLVGP
jgi:hypothetical protein